MRTALLLLFLGVTIQSFSQIDRSATDQYLKDQEQMRRANVLRTMDSAIVDMNEGRYALAEEKYLFVLANIKGVPSDLTFFFGKNSYYLKKYKQSVDWINKYIQLKGTTGQYSLEAIDLLKKAEAEVILERSKETIKAQEVLSQDYDIDCGPSGLVTCPVCRGTTVIITRGAFNNQYKTCPYCDNHGRLTCTEYNQLLRGELTPRQ
jgi:hypothetical protein